MNQPDPEFAQVQQAAGAVMSDATTIAPMALHFGDARSEYQAAKTDAVVVDLNDRTQIELTGADRQKFLHKFCTNDISALTPGQGCEAFVTNVKGKVLAHIFVFAAADRLAIDTVPGAGDALLTHLDRYLIREDVQLQERTAELGTLLVSGANATQHMQRIEQATQPLTRYEHVSAAFETESLEIRRVDWLDQPGYLLCLSKPRLAELWKSLIDSNLRPAGAAAFHALRIEAGMPLYGQDIDQNNLAQEVARTELAVSFTKGCYLGQEPIARIDALGHVNRELRRLRVISSVAPAPGSVVVALDDDTVQVGSVTSSAFSLQDQNPVVLAYLRSQVASPDTRVRVVTDSGLVEASVF